MNLRPDASAARCREAVGRLESERAVERIWAGDASFWKTEAAARKSIENALGWLTIPDRIEPELPSLEAFVDEARRDADRIVVLGMGGSSLAPYVFARTFGPAPGFPRLEVLDSTEPSTVAACAARNPPARTIYIVSSKSGTTLEPNIFFDYFYDRAKGTLGDGAGARFLVITDPGSALEKEAASRRVRRIFPGDPQIGGRYSALSHFGLVPAAFLGVPVRELVLRARRMAEACRAVAGENPGLLLGASIGAEALARHDKLTFSIGEPAGRFGMWLEQLIAESTGKEGKGILPVEGEPLGAPGVYGPDRFFMRCTVAGREDRETAARLEDLAARGHSEAEIALEDPLDLGAEMFRWEFATAVAGRLLGINPFDQPNVQEAKDRTQAILSGESAPPSPGGSAPASSPEGVDPAAVSGLLSSIEPGDYFAITAYLDETPEVEDALRAIRLRVRDARRVATTVGFGPRFLHSTGQLHKGGPADGVFLQITAEPATSVPIPGRPWGFGEVIAAQAAGDLAALQARGRRVGRVHLGRDVGAGLRRLSDAVARALA